MDIKMFDRNMIELCIHVWCCYNMVTTHKQTIAETFSSVGTSMCHLIFDWWDNNNCLKLFYFCKHFYTCCLLFSLPFYCETQY